MSSPSTQRKHPVIQTCTNCGALNEAASERCCFCDARLAPDGVEPSAEGAYGAKAVPRLSTKLESASGSATLPEWRAEVSERLRGYRARHRGNTASHASDDDGSQAALPFLASELTVEPAVAEQDELDDPLQASLSSAAARLEQVQLTRGTAKSASADAARDSRFTDSAQRAADRLLIDVSRAPQNETGTPALSTAAHLFSEHQVTAAIPVADLPTRRRAALIDALCLLLALSGVLGLYVAFGGKLVASKLDLSVSAAALFLLYVQYFTLFTVMGGSTPGMMFTGLRVVSFEAGAPEPSHLLRRSFGYVISGVTAMFGFFWALWDEDQLTWHDRISQTFLVHAELLICPPIPSGSNAAVDHP